MDSDNMTIEFFKTQERISNHLENNTKATLELSESIKENNRIGQEINAQNHTAIQELLAMANATIKGKEEVIITKNEQITEHRKRQYKLERLVIILAILIIIILGGYTYLKLALKLPI